MTTKQEVAILEYNPGTMSLKIQEMVEAGWSVDPDRPLVQLGFTWECWFIRDASDEQLAIDADAAAKPSRAEILAKARAAKAEKAELKGTTNE